ncbi:hypothetical protein ABNF65_16500, partial [Paenibacillus larvae]
EGYEYGSFHFLEPSFLHNYTDSTTKMDKIVTLKVIPNEVLAIITRTIPIANSPIASKLYLLNLYLATL